MVSLSNHRPEPFGSPFALSRSLLNGRRMNGCSGQALSKGKWCVGATAQKDFTDEGTECYLLGPSIPLRSFGRYQI